MEEKILARVGKREITEEDLRRLRLLLGDQAQHFQGPEGDKQLLNELINQELLYLDAKDKGMDQDAAYLDQVKTMKKDLLQQYALKSLLGLVQVTTEETEDYYQKHQGEYSEEDKKDMPKLMRQIYMQLTLVKQQATYVKYVKELEEKYKVKRID